MKRRNGSFEKSARLVMLMRWQDEGKLRLLTLQQIAEKFPDVPSVRTICRDLKDVYDLRKFIKGYYP